jgi:hypothetical protein
MNRFKGLAESVYNIEFGNFGGIREREGLGTLD